MKERAHRRFDRRPSPRAARIAYNRAREVYPGWWAPDVAWGHLPTIEDLRRAVPNIVARAEAWNSIRTLGDPLDLNATSEYAPPKK